MDELSQVLSVLNDLQEDNMVSKNIKQKVASMKFELENSKKEDLSLKINRVLCDLEDISSDVNLPTFVRTQIWHLTSMLEKMC